MKNDEREEQLQNAKSGICERPERESSVTVDSFSQAKKQDSSMILTEEGRQMDKSDEHSAKADWPMCIRCESDSKATPESVLHHFRHFSWRISMEEGIKTE
jgi:hypothetical protein